MRRPFVVFLIALFVRIVVYLLVMSSPDAVKQPDSVIYLAVSENLLDQGSYYPREGRVSAFMVRTPLYPVLVASILGLFRRSLLDVVLIQVLFDSITCVMVYYLAEKVRNGTGLLSGLLAAANLGMVTYSHFILNDSFFVLGFVGVLLGMLYVLDKGSLRSVAYLGAASGCAVLIRPVAAYLPLFLAPPLMGALMVRHRQSLFRAAGKVAVMIGAFALFVLPWMGYNKLHLGRFRLTAQSGEHLLQYVVPFVWQYSKGIPFSEGMNKASEMFERRAGEEGLDIAKAGPFEMNDFQVDLAKELLGKEPISAVVKAWSFGIAKNLLAPALIDFSYLLGIERPHFFQTKGGNAFRQTINFIGGMKGVFGYVLIGSMTLLFLSRLLQIWGVVLLFREKRWEAVCFISVISYFLLVSGPVGYAKYRLPFEPVLCILLAVALKDIYRGLFAGIVWRNDGKLLGHSRSQGCDCGKGSK